MGDKLSELDEVEDVEVRIVRCFEERNCWDLCEERR